MSQQPDTYTILEIQALSFGDIDRRFVDRSEYDRLKQERDALAMQVAGMREAITKHCRYIDNDGLFCCGICGHVLGSQHHAKCVMALHGHSEVIKRHDAAVLRNVAGEIICAERVLLDGMHPFTALKIQGLLLEAIHIKADELEKS